MSRLFAFVVLILIVFHAFGCGGPEKPVEVDVQGKVTLDRKPLNEGTIVFITPGYPGDTLDIKNGAYTGKARIGEKRRVEIYAYKDGPLDKDPMSGEPIKTKILLVAPHYNTHSTLTTTIAQGADNTFHYDVMSP